MFLHTWETSSRRGTQFHAEKWLDFVLSLDPIGDRRKSIMCLYMVFTRIDIRTLASPVMIYEQKLSTQQSASPVMIYGQKLRTQ